MPVPSPLPDRRSGGRLCDRLITLAATPDDASTVATDLIVIAQLAADLLGAVSYASITGCAAEGRVTVAASSDLAVAVDEAQYADDAGPCLQALAGGRPVAVPDIAAIVPWPRFREVAAGLGLRASLSLPLFAARGGPIAALNLYSHDGARMGELIAAVRPVYEGLDEGPEEDAAPRGRLDAGDEELVAGLTGASAVRSSIEQALGVVMSITGQAPEGAYAALRSHAAEAGVTLTEMAGRLAAGQRW